MLHARQSQSAGDRTHPRLARGATCSSTIYAAEQQQRGPATHLCHQERERIFSALHVDRDCNTVSTGGQTIDLSSCWPAPTHFSDRMASVHCYYPVLPLTARFSLHYPSPRRPSPAFDRTQGRPATTAVRTCRRNASHARLSSRVSLTGWAPSQAHASAIRGDLVAA